MSQSFFYRYKLHHLLFWLLLFGAWFYFRYQDFASINIALLITAIKVLDLAMLVYITNYILIPRFLYKKQYVLFGLLFFVMISVSSLFKIYIIGQIIYPSGTFVLFDSDFKARVYDNVIPHFLLVSTGAAFKLLLDYAKAQRRLGELAKEKAETELTFLKSQMNPHFLFNALNSVYFLIDKNNPGAREALHKFSDMLRYQLYEVKDEKIAIEKEIEYLKDYIDVQSLRRENSIVNINIDTAVKGFFIEPLLLIPFIENSFKHLSHFSNSCLLTRSDADDEALQGRQNEIDIQLSRQNGEMIFAIKNTTEGKEKQTVMPGGGIGLSNVKRRLELLYPQKHQLTIKQTDGYFDVQLNLKID
ncbi:MAG TPA: histidine kinase [Chitinophagaceae bacterium]|nr:histidine kinase [Chitinophagaceae bacterium]